MAAAWLSLVSLLGLVKCPNGVSDLLGDSAIIMRLGLINFPPRGAEAVDWTGRACSSLRRDVAPGLLYWPLWPVEDASSRPGDFNLWAVLN